MAKTIPLKVNQKTGVVASVELPECPVCFETMSAPILLCKTGHSICHSCTKNLSPPKCPICRQNMTEMRNFQMEDLISNAVISCPNQGCQFMMVSTKVNEHANECTFRKMKCPYEKLFGSCSWTGKLTGLMAHFNKKHRECVDVYMDSDIELEIPRGDDDEGYLYLTTFGSEHFLLYIEFNSSESTVHWIVQYIGNKEEAKQYTYEILLTDKQDSERKVKFYYHCSDDSSDIDDIISDGHCISMPINFLDDYEMDDIISFRFSVAKKNHTEIATNKASTPGTSTATNPMPHSSKGAAPSTGNRRKADKSRSEATFRFKVHDPKNLENCVLSPTFYVRNLPWRLKVGPKRTKKQCSLSVFLVCNGDDSQWSCFAKSELRVICHKPNSKHFSRNTEHLYNRDAHDWGYEDFMSWSDVLNPQLGYLKDGSITVEAKVIADLPKGLRL